MVLEKGEGPFVMMSLAPGIDREDSFAAVFEMGRFGICDEIEIFISAAKLDHKRSRVYTCRPGEADLMVIVTKTPVKADFEPV